MLSGFVLCLSHLIYRETSNISHTLIGNKLVDHWDVGWASPVGAAPTTSSFLTPGFNGLGKDKSTRRAIFKFWDLVWLIIEVWRFSLTKVIAVWRHIDGLVQKKDVTPLLMHWSYVFLALIHRYICNLVITSLGRLAVCSAEPLPQLMMTDCQIVHKN